MNILVTGGLGFIGSHTAVELIAAGHKPFIVDSLVNSEHNVLEKLERLTGSSIPLLKADIRDTKELIKFIESNKIDAVIHFAALKAVGESTQKPLEYYSNNIGGLISLLSAMLTNNVRNIIFSSSATVYGDPDSVPISESTPLKDTTNPYGETKQMAERILEDISKSENLKTISLRYFNPIGAHSSGLIGELPKGAPNNLVPYVTQVAAGVRTELTVFGNDYDTPDGSGVRDYIHVVDLAKAHAKALGHLKEQNPGVNEVFNIGAGKGASVLEVIKTFEKVSGTKVPYKIGPRRAGDVASIFADPSRAEKVLGWKAELTLEQALEDAWRWQQNLK